MGTSRGSAGRRPSIGVLIAVLLAVLVVLAVVLFLLAPSQQVDNSGQCGRVVRVLPVRGFRLGRQLLEAVVSLDGKLLIVQLLLGLLILDTVAERAALFILAPQNRQLGGQIAKGVLGRAVLRHPLTQSAQRVHTHLIRLKITSDQKIRRSLRSRIRAIRSNRSLLRKEILRISSQIPINLVSRNLMKPLHTIQTRSLK